MPDYDPLDRESDPFQPPAISTLVSCLHCGQEYDSFRIEWRIEHGADGRPHGFWCCPIPGCDGKGFGFDIFPVDPDYRDERGGWFNDDESEADDNGDGKTTPQEPPRRLDGTGEDEVPW